MKKIKRDLPPEEGSGIACGGRVPVLGPAAAKRIAKLASRLRAMRHELEDEFSHASNELGGERSTSAPEDSAATQTSDLMASSTMRHISLRLREIDAALERIADGTFGRCSECGERIPESRLAANPLAARCIPCQQAAEKRRR